MIQVGDQIPDVKLRQLGEGGMQEVSTGELFKGRKVVMFGLPGAFTPTCSAKHLPGFINKADELRAKGVDEIVCLSVNDAFVMQAWAKDQHAEDKVNLLPDGNGEFTRALGLEMDGAGFGMGQRCKRFALIAEDGKVTGVFVEEPGAFEVSSAEAVMAEL
jgi:peroxiredoxin